MVEHDPSDSSVSMELDKESSPLTIDLHEELDLKNVEENTKETTVSVKSEFITPVNELSNEADKEIQIGYGEEEFEWDNAQETAIEEDAIKIQAVIRGQEQRKFLEKKKFEAEEKARSTCDEALKKEPEADCEEDILIIQSIARSQQNSPTRKRQAQGEEKPEAQEDGKDSSYQKKSVNLQEDSSNHDTSDHNNPEIVLDDTSDHNSPEILLDEQPSNEVVPANFKKELPSNEIVPTNLEKEMPSNEIVATNLQKEMPSKEIVPTNLKKIVPTNLKKDMPSSEIVARDLKKLTIGVDGPPVNLTISEEGPPVNISSETPWSSRSLNEEPYKLTISEEGPPVNISSETPKSSKSLNEEACTGFSDEDDMEPIITVHVNAGSNDNLNVLCGSPSDKDNRLIFSGEHLSEDIKKYKTRGGSTVWCRSTVQCLEDSYGHMIHLPDTSLELLGIFGHNIKIIVAQARSAIFFAEANYLIKMDADSKQQTFFKHDSNVTSLALDENLIAVGLESNGIIVWDLHRDTASSIHLNNRVNSLHLIGCSSSDWVYVLSYSADDSLRIFSLNFHRKQLCLVSAKLKHKINIIVNKFEPGTFLTIGPEPLRIWTFNGRKLTSVLARSGVETIRNVKSGCFVNASEAILACSERHPILVKIKILCNNYGDIDIVDKIKLDAPVGAMCKLGGRIAIGGHAKGYYELWSSGKLSRVPSKKCYINDKKGKVRALVGLRKVGTKSQELLILTNDGKVFINQEQILSGFASCFTAHPEVPKVLFASGRNQLFAVMSFHAESCELEMECNKDMSRHRIEAIGSSRKAVIMVGSKGVHRLNWELKSHHHLAMNIPKPRLVEVSPRSCVITNSVDEIFVIDLEELNLVSKLTLKAGSGKIDAVSINQNGTFLAISTETLQLFYYRINKKKSSSGVWLNNPPYCDWTTWNHRLGWDIRGLTSSEAPNMAIPSSVVQLGNSVIAVMGGSIQVFNRPVSDTEAPHLKFDISTSPIKRIFVSNSRDGNFLWIIDSEGALLLWLLMRRKDVHSPERAHTDRDHDRYYLEEQDISPIWDSHFDKNKGRSTELETVLERPRSAKRKKKPKKKSTRHFPLQPVVTPPWITERKTRNWERPLSSRPKNKKRTIRSLRNECERLKVTAYECEAEFQRTKIISFRKTRRLAQLNKVIKEVNSHKTFPSTLRKMVMQTLLDNKVNLTPRQAVIQPEEPKSLPDDIDLDLGADPFFNDEEPSPTKIKDLENEYEELKSRVLIKRSRLLKEHKRKSKSRPTKNALEKKLSSQMCSLEMVSFEMDQKLERGQNQIEQLEKEKQRQIQARDKIRNRVKELKKQIDKGTEEYQSCLFTARR